MKRYAVSRKEASCGCEFIYTNPNHGHNVPEVKDICNTLNTNLAKIGQLEKRVAELENMLRRTVVALDDARNYEYSLAQEVSEAAHKVLSEKVQG